MDFLKSLTPEERKYVSSLPEPAAIQIIQQLMTEKQLSQANAGIDRRMGHLDNLMKYSNLPSGDMSAFQSDMQRLETRQGVLSKMSPVSTKKTAEPQPARPHPDLAGIDRRIAYLIGQVKYGGLRPQDSEGFQSEIAHLQARRAALMQSQHP